MMLLSRETILKYSKDVYEHWLEYINKHDEKESHSIAVAFEYLWHVIYGGEDFISSEACIN